MKQEMSIPNGPIRFLIFVSKPYRKWVIIASLSVLIASILTSSIAYIIKKIIDNVYNQSDFYTILFWVIAYPAIFLISGLIWRMSGVAGSRWSLGADANGYKTLAEYMSKHSQSFFDNRFAGSLVSSINTASGATGSIIEMYLWTYLETFVALIISIFLVSTASPLLGIIFLTWAIILIPINYHLAKKKKVLASRASSLETEMKGKAVDMTSNMNIVHLFARRKMESEKLGEAVDLQRDAHQKSWSFSEKMITLNDLLLSIFLACIVFVSFYLWKNGVITLGEFIMVVTLVSSLMNSLTFIGTSMNQFAKHYGEVKKGLEEILHPHEIVDKKRAKKLKVQDGKVEFKNVTFRYHSDKAILNDLSLEIKPGQRVGIVGPSGAGKTTFIRTLLRQHEVNNGSICIDNQNINEVTLDSLRDSIGIVPQEPALFHRSIRENIAYGNIDATKEDIEKAAHLAQAHEFIESLPDKYETLVGERGVKLSAGQRQRIAIARAILKDAKILILDEATSALDSESEVAIQKALEELMKEKTVLAVAHRLSTLSEMDRIIVLKNGKIVEDGSHQELLKNKNGTYAKLWSHQAGGFLEE